MKEQIKSGLQEKLESEGWSFLTNENPFAECRPMPVKGRGILATYVLREEPLTDLQLKDRFLQRGFNQVHVSDAYDIEGKIVPGMRAVYVKQ